MVILVDGISRIMYMNFIVKYAFHLVIPLTIPLVTCQTTENYTETTTENENILGEFPYQTSPYISVVSLHYTYNDQFICAGSIISSRVVITAAHCMYYKWGGLLPPIIVRVSAGRRSLNESSWKNFDVADIKMHPSFNKTTMEYNLALIEVKEQFPTNDLIGRVSMEKYIPEVQYINCVITGWSQNTKMLEVSEVDIIYCENYPYHLCSVKLYEDTVCINDPGNPLICNGKLVGVLSVEPDCADPFQLTIFENIRNSMAWLNEFDTTSSNKKSSSWFYLLLVSAILLSRL